MRTSIGRGILATFTVLFSAIVGLHAQSSGNSGTIYGTVADQSGAVISNASVTVENPVSRFSSSTTSDSNGRYQFTNLPMNPYHLTITASGFSTVSQDVDVRSIVPITLNNTLRVGGESTTVTVEASDLLENDPSFHTDVDRGLFRRLPLESQSSSLSSLITLASPGIAADSNGLFHGLGDHAENSFSIDGQPVTDQQGVLEPDSLEFYPVDGSDRWRPYRRIRRQDQRCRSRHHAVWSRVNDATRQYHGFLWNIWFFDLECGPCLRK